jgi:hypothetical protein
MVGLGQRGRTTILQHDNSKVGVGRVSGAREKLVKKTYIRTPKFPQPAFDKALAECKADKSWATFELADTGHMAMLDAPERVTDLVLQAA